MKFKHILKKNALALALPLLFLAATGCGMFPDRLIYPTDMPKKVNTEDDNTIEVTDGESAEETDIADEEDGYGEEAATSPDDQVLFGGDSSAKKQRSKPEQEYAPSPATGSERANKIKRYEKMMRERPLTQREHKRYRKLLGPIQAGKSSKGYNALTRKFNAPADVLWNTVVDIMLSKQIETVDKGSGLIISGWSMDKRKTTNVSADGILSSMGIDRLVRYKYTVRVYALANGQSEVTVVPFTQVSVNRRWHDGKPARSVAEKLMRKIIKRMGG